VIKEVQALDTPLRRWRLERNLTQTEAGDMIGVEQRNYSRYELGEKHIPYKYLEKIHELTKIPYLGLLNPQKFLREHPDFLAHGKRPLQGRGWPKGRPRPRKIAVAQ
jgi:transcriptional regulator with XRE-family HTH domain